MTLKKVIYAFFLIAFSMQANAQIEAELDNVQGITYCSFKESKKGGYSYCSDKIKNIFISVSFSKSVSISPHPQSISADYIYKYISNYYKNLDDEIDEFNYGVSFIPPGKWSREKNRKNYLYLHAKFFPIEGNKIICVLLFDRNGRYETDSFLIDISRGDYDTSFKNELEKINVKLGYELISRKGI